MNKSIREAVMSARADSETTTMQARFGSGEIDLSVVVPTYKEVENLRPLIERIFQATARARCSAEVLIVDDDSRDGTEAEVRHLSGRYNVRMITRRGERGLATAVLLGLREAKAPVLLVMDADLSHPPELIPDFLAALKAGAEFVVGSRYMPGAGIEEGWGLIRWLNSAAATVLARPLTAISDPLSGYFALRRDVFRRSRPLAPVGYKICLELLIKSDPRKVSELPIYFTDRAAGRSKLSVRIQLQYLKHLRRLYTYRFPFLMEAAQFLVVGALGLAADVSVYAVLQAAFGTNHLVARSLSFIAAATQNWLLNRRYTFLSGRAMSPGPQWLAYVAAMTVGFVINVGTYATLTAGVPVFAQRRYAALFAGSALAAAFNFVAARWYVFRNVPSSAGGPLADVRAYEPDVAIARDADAKAVIGTP